MKERLSTWLNSLTAKYMAVPTLLVAVPAIGISRVPSRFVATTTTSVR